MSAERQGQLLPDELRRIGEAFSLAAGLIGLGAFVLCHWLSGPEFNQGSSFVYWACALGVLLLPAIHGLLTELLQRWIPGLKQPALWALAPQLLPVVVWPIVSPAHWLLLVLTLFQANLVSRPRHVIADSWMVALAPVQVLVAMSAMPDTLWLLALPLVVLISCCALLFLSVRYHFERMELRSARPFVRAWLQVDQGETGGLDARPRLRSASRYALLLLGLIAVSYPMLVALPRPSFNPRRASFSSREAQDTRNADNQPGNLDNSGSADNSFPGDIRPGGSLGNLSYETVITMAAYEANGDRSQPLDVGPIYLRAIYLDTFTETGLRSNRRKNARKILDGSDGASDGWTQLTDSGGPQTLHLEIQQNALRLKGSDELLIFAAQPALAIRLPEVLNDPDRFLCLPRGIDVAEFSYGLRTAADRLPDSVLEPLSARHGQSRFLQLPADSEELAWLTERARQITRGTHSDLERVQAVLEHFHHNFAYTTDTSDVPGVRGIANFMRRERGHCTSFAAAATLLLRSCGIPARVATGFLASQVSESSGLYDVTRRNGHAWIEVHFEGVGWQRFEPTPSARRQAALLADAEGGGDGLQAWSRVLISDLKAWAKSGADEAYLDQLLETLAQGPSALWVSLRRQAWIVLIPLVLVALLVRRRFGGRRGSERSSAAEEQRESLLEALLNTLKEQGFRRSRASTLREFASRVRLDRQRGPELQLELLAIVELFYRARFGDRALEAPEVSHIQAWITELRTPQIPEASS